MDKILKLLEIAKKFGVKPSKVIGTQGNIVPYKKPSLVAVNVDEFKLKESIDSGAMTMDKVQQEMEETVRLALSKNLNDVELNRALNNAINIDRQFFPPSADVIAAGSKQQVTGKGLEELIKKEGLVASPKTPLGKIQLQGKRLEQEAKDLSKEFDLGALIKGAGKDQLSEIKLHNEGLVRAVTRQILSEDIKAGKIKNLTLEDLGTSREPIDYFRKIYGEDALERLDSLTPEFNRLNTEQEAAGLARFKFKFEPDETRTKGSISYEELEKNIKGSEQPKETKVLDITIEGNKRKSIDDLIDEYNANQDRLRLSDEEGGTAIGYQEFQDIQKRNEDIAKALEEKGISSAIEEEVKPEGIVIPFRKKFPKPEPEGKAQGGIIGYAMGGKVKRKNYGFGSILKKPMSFYTPTGEPLLKQVSFLDLIKDPSLFAQQVQSQQPEIPLTLTERYNKYLSAAGSGTGDELYKSYRANLDKKADGGRIGYAKGKRVKSSIDKLIDQLNKKTQGKKSMESVDPKTGEVTVPKKPIRRAEEPTGVTVMDAEPETIDERAITKNKSRKLTQDEIADYEELIGRDSEQWISEGTVEEAEKALKRSKAEEAYYLQQYKTGQLDPKPGEKSQSRMRFLQKKAEEAADVKDKRLFSLDESDELDELERTFNKKNTSTGGFSFNDPDIKAQMEEAMKEAKKRSDEMRAMGLDPAKSKDYDQYIETKTKSGDKNFNKYFDDLEIKTKFKGVISDDLLNQILIDDNPQRKAEVIATIEEGLKMQEKGMSPEQIIDILKNTTRTKQAEGGIAGLL